MKGREKSMGNYRGKEGKRRKTGRYGWGGMKGNGENVGEDKRKEERNDGRKERETAEVHAVFTGDHCSTYGRLLQYLRKSTGVIGGRTVIPYTTPAALL